MAAMLIYCAGNVDVTAQMSCLSCASSGPRLALGILFPPWRAGVPVASIVDSANCNYQDNCHLPCACVCRNFGVDEEGHSSIVILAL